MAVCTRAKLLRRSRYFLCKCLNGSMILPIEFESSRLENVTAHTVKLQRVRCLRRVYYGPPFVLCQVSFGCWVMWAISSWKKYYKSVFFPKLSDKYWNFYFCLSGLRPELSAKIILSILSDLPLTRKNWENWLPFKVGNFWVINWPKQFCQSAK